MKNLGVRFVIVGRILDGKETVGYDLASSNSDIIPTRKEQVQKLASRGYITNAKAEVNKTNGKITLHGKQGTQLNKLAFRQIQVGESLM